MADPSSPSLRSGAGDPVARVELHANLGTAVHVLVHDDALRALVEETFPARLPASVRARARAIAEALTSLRHPNVAPVLRVETHGEATVVTSQLVVGERLDELVAASNSALSLPVRLRIVVDVLSGLSALHGRVGPIGCLAPAHVIVGVDGIARIVHVARAALPTALLGPLGAFVAPEVRDGTGAEAADVWSVGMLLAESLARRAVDPSSPSGAATMRAGLGDAAWAEPLVALAIAATSEDAASRPRSPAELAAAVRMIVRSRLADHGAVAREVEEYAGERIATRRGAWLRTSGKVRIPVGPSPFDAPTAPVGMRTLAANDQAATDLAEEELEVDVDLDVVAEPAPLALVEAPARDLVFEPPVFDRTKLGGGQPSEVFFAPDRAPQTLPPEVPSIPPPPSSGSALERSVIGGEKARPSFESTGGMLVPPVDVSAVEPVPSAPFPAPAPRSVARRAALAVVLVALALVVATVLAALALRGRASVPMHADAASSVRPVPQGAQPAGQQGQQQGAALEPRSVREDPEPLTTSIARPAPPPSAAPAKTPPAKGRGVPRGGSRGSSQQGSGAPYTPSSI